MVRSRSLNRLSMISGVMEYGSSFRPSHLGQRIYYGTRSPAGNHGLRFMGTIATGLGVMDAKLFCCGWHRKGSTRAIGRSHFVSWPPCMGDLHEQCPGLERSSDLALESRAW